MALHDQHDQHDQPDHRDPPDHHDPGAHDRPTGSGATPPADRLTRPLELPRELPESRRRFVVGISGASGAHYACRLLELLLVGGHEVHLVVSDYGKRLLHDEGNLYGRAVTRISFDQLLPDLASSHLGEAAASRLFIHPNADVGAVIASGSFLHDGMAVIPCSSSSLGAMASGAGSNLLTRAAMVTLKERRTLVVCHREMPLSLIDIENMRMLALAGAVLCSPNPGFYLHPRDVGDIIDFTVGKVLDLLRTEHALATRWSPAGASSRAAGQGRPSQAGAGSGSA